MTNPTSNYSFQMPTATDLVTDLPADFEVFGQAVDTRLKALQPGTTLGDIAYSSATANTNTRLGIGTNGQVLAVSGGVPAWTTTADVTPLTTKGDLFTFTTVDARIGVGANGTVLTADSAEATGLKWATPAAGGGLTLISSVTLSGSSTTLSSIPGTYKYLYLLGRTLSGSNQIDILPNNNASSADFSLIQNSTLSAIAGATIYSTGDKGPASSGSSNLNAFAITINGYAISGTGKPFQVYGNTYDGTTKWKHSSFGIWAQSGAITSLVFNGGASTSGTVDVYGGN